MMDEDMYPEDDFLGEDYHQQSEELFSIPDAYPDEEGLIECPVIPLRDVVFFPHMVSPFFIGSQVDVQAIEAAHYHQHTMIGLALRNMDVETPRSKDFIPIGVEMAVGRLVDMPEGFSSTLVQVRRRVRVVKFTQAKPFLRVRARPVFETDIPGKEADALMRTALNFFKKCVQLNENIPEEAFLYATNIDNPGWLADMIATAVAPPIYVLQKLLVTVNPLDRLRMISGHLAKEIDVLELEEEIQTRLQKEMDKGQREIYLRERMKIIQSELGEGDIWMREVEEVRKRIEAVKLSEEARSRALSEVERLGQVPLMSPEVGIIRTYIEWILDLPWVDKTEDDLDVGHASEVLEEHHYGLTKAKERILEYIAVRSLKPKQERQPILCFVGPPGTGKTSLGQSIAKALGRKFIRLSLGGVHDEAEIRGHRRTYVGALPGRILQTMRRANTINPLFMLDEVDKLGLDYRGDPAAALLEVLDTEQNHAFSDHYLEIPYDLSNVMFITTANITSTIPAALLDRMEVINFPSYIEEEKIEIARRFLIPRLLRENGLESETVNFSLKALQTIIREYTYEAGVRNLERELGKIFRKLARSKAEGKGFPARINASMLERFLGPPQHYNFMAEKEDEVGVATALAWTENGGELMPVEVLLMEGKGNVQITGLIGDVMQESAQAALSYLRSRSQQFNLPPKMFEETDIHIHIPEGAIPKDGPSAGITIATAVISAFTGCKVRRSVGMTGEITLRGRILPVGGMREKILAAYRVGLKVVVLPERNMKDLVEVPQKAQSSLKFVPVNHIDQVLKVALIPPGDNQARGGVNDGSKRQ
ncbi:MAG: endopeptidase La [Chloroflexota bacterium]